MHLEFGDSRQVMLLHCLGKGQYEDDSLQTIIQETIKRIINSEDPKSTDNRRLKKNINELYHALITSNKKEACEHAILASDKTATIETKEVQLRFIEALARTGLPFIVRLAARKWHHLLVVVTGESVKGNDDPFFRSRLFILGKWLLKILLPTILEESIGICNALLQEKALSANEALGFFDDFCQVAMKQHGSSPPEGVLFHLGTLIEGVVPLLSQNESQLQETFSQSYEWFHSALCQEAVRIPHSHVILKQCAAKQLVIPTLFRVTLKNIDQYEAQVQQERGEIALFLTKNLPMTPFLPRDGGSAFWKELQKLTKKNLFSSEILLEFWLFALKVFSFDPILFSFFKDIKFFNRIISLFIESRKVTEFSFLLAKSYLDFLILKQNLGDSERTNEAGGLTRLINFFISHVSTVQSELEKRFREFIPIQQLEIKVSQRVLAFLSSCGLTLSEKKELSPLPSSSKKNRKKRRSHLPLSIAPTTQTNEIETLLSLMKDSTLSRKKSKIKKALEAIQKISFQEFAEENFQRVASLWILVLTRFVDHFPYETLTLVFKNYEYLVQLFNSSLNASKKASFYELVFKLCLKILVNVKENKDYDLSCVLLVLKMNLEQLKNVNLSSKLKESIYACCEQAAYSSQAVAFLPFLDLLRNQKVIDFIRMGHILSTNSLLSSKSLEFFVQAAIECSHGKGSHVNRITPNERDKIIALFDRLIPQANEKELALISCFLTTHPSFCHPSQSFQSLFANLFTRKFLLAQTTPDKEQRAKKVVSCIDYLMKNFSFFYKLQTKTLQDFINQCVDFFLKDSALEELQKICLYLGECLSDSPFLLDLLIKTLLEHSRNSELISIAYYLIRNFVFLNRNPSNELCLLLQKYLPHLIGKKFQTDDFLIKVLQSPLLEKKGRSHEWGNFLNLIAEVALEIAEEEKQPEVFVEAYKLFIEIHKILLRDKRESENTLHKGYHTCLTFLEVFPDNLDIQSAFRALDVIASTLNSLSEDCYHKVVKGLLKTMESISPSHVEFFFDLVKNYLTHRCEKMPLEKKEKLLYRLFVLLCSKPFPSENLVQKILDFLEGKFCKEILKEETQFIFAASLLPSLYRKWNDFKNEGQMRKEFERFIYSVIALNQTQAFLQLATLFEEIPKDFIEESMEKLFKEVITAARGKIHEPYHHTSLHVFFFHVFVKQEKEASLSPERLALSARLLVTLLEVMLTEAKKNYFSELFPKLVSDAVGYITLAIAIFKEHPQLIFKVIHEITLFIADDLHLVKSSIPSLLFLFSKFTEIKEKEDRVACLQTLNTILKVLYKNGLPSPRKLCEIDFGEMYESLPELAAEAKKYL